MFPFSSHTKNNFVTISQNHNWNRPKLKWSSSEIAAKWNKTCARFVAFSNTGEYLFRDLTTSAGFTALYKQLTTIFYRFTLFLHTNSQLTNAKAVVVLLRLYAARGERVLSSHSHEQHLLLPVCAVLHTYLHVPCEKKWIIYCIYACGFMSGIRICLNLPGFFVLKWGLL